MRYSGSCDIWLLEYSRIQSGTFDLTLSRVNLEDVVSFVHRMSSGAAQAKGVQLRIECSENDETWVTADRQGLIQIGLNLVGNALKFTDAGGTVTLKVAQGDEGYIGFFVSDTGTGIPPEKLQEVLQPFVRLGDASLASETGTGLGLAIVTALADAMEMPFSLHSTVGEGTNARLSIPVASNPAQTSRR